LLPGRWWRGGDCCTIASEESRAPKKAETAMPDYREFEDTFASRHAAEWGLASLLMGGVLTIIAPITMVFNLNFWVRGRQVLARQDMELAFYAAILGVAVVLLLCFLSLLFGIKALRSARRHYQ